MVEKLRDSLFLLRQDLRRSWQQALPVLTQLAAAGFAALMAGATLMGQLAPLGVALVAGVPEGGLLAVAAGAVAGSAISLPFAVSGRYLAGVLAALAARLLLIRLGSKWDPAICASFLGSVVMLAVQLACSWQLGGGALPVANTVSEGLLAIGMGVMFSLALPALLSGRPLADQPAALQGAAALCAGAMLLALGRIRLAGLNLGLLVLGALLLTAALSGAGRAAVLGLTAAAVLFLKAPAEGWQALGLAAAALAASAFRSRGRPAMAGCFAAAAFLGLPGAPGPAAGLWYIAGAGCSAAAFLLLPSRWLAGLLQPGENGLSEAALTGQMTGRLYALGDALCQAGEMVEEVCRRLPGPRIPLEELYERVAGGPCAGCPGHQGCWGANSSRTLDGLAALREKLSGGPVTDAAALPPELQGCRRPQKLLAAAEGCRTALLARRAAAAQAGSLRGAMGQQYAALAQALGQLAGELQQQAFLDRRRTDLATELFCDLGLPPLEAFAVTGADGRCRITVRTARTQLSEEEEKELCAELSVSCRRAFGCARHTAFGAVSQFEFFESPPFEPRFATACRSAGGGVSADAVRSFCDARGRAHLILCDGMGVGQAAAVDGALAASLSRQLIDAGFGGEAAARLVNAALSAKGEDSGAALDLLTVDLYTGSCELYKAGAAPTYLVRRGRAIALANGGLPVGILNGVVGQHLTATLRDGDLAVMVSDGAIAAGDGWLKAALEEPAGEGPQALADRLLQGAAGQEQGRPDDITVAVLQLCRVH